jgi:hypothetical protein
MIGTKRNSHMLSNNYATFLLIDEFGLKNILLLE